MILILILYKQMTIKVYRLYNNVLSALSDLLKADVRWSWYITGKESVQRWPNRLFRLVQLSKLETLGSCAHNDRPKCSLRSIVP